MRRDKDRLVLKANKGVAMDREDYISKSNKLIAQPAYRAIPRDPTYEIKTKLIIILKG